MESVLKTLYFVSLIVMVILHGKVRSSAAFPELPVDFLSSVKRTPYGPQEQQLNSNDDVTANRLSVVRISSSGFSTELLGEVVLVFVFFTGEGDESLAFKWTIRRNNGTEERKGGSLFKGTMGRSSHMSYIIISNFSATESVAFEMSTYYQFMYFQLNLTKLASWADYDFPNPNTVIEMNKTYVAPSGLDLHITAIVNGSHSQTEDILDSAEVVIQYLNTNSDPPVVETKDNRNPGVFDLNVQQVTRETSKLEITTKAQYAKYGGLLILLFRREVDDSILTGSLYEGYVNEIASSDSNEVVPRNNMGISYFPEVVVLSGMRSPVSITCPAIGNPKPRVSILKVSADKTTEIRMDTEPGFPASSVRGAQTLFLRVDDPTSPGTYICRATSGTKTVEKIAEVIFEEKALKFDETETGVMQNTTDTLVVSCKASGLPRPVVLLQLYDDNGLISDMYTSSIFKISRTEPEDETATIKLVVFPRNRDVRTVECIAKNYISSTSERIDVFPGINQRG